MLGWRMGVERPLYEYHIAFVPFNAGHGSILFSLMLGSLIPEMLGCDIFRKKNHYRPQVQGMLN